MQSALSSRGSTKSAVDRLSKCPECGSNKNLIEDEESSELICTNCGTVVSEGTPTSKPEWRIFDSEQLKRSRVGPPATYTQHDRGMSTIIDPRMGKGLKGDAARGAWRLRTLQKRVASSGAERTLVASLQMIDRFADQLSLPKSIQEQASQIFHKAHKAGILKGHPSHIMAVVVLFVACRQAGLPRTMNEFIDLVGNRVNRRKSYRSNRKTFYRCYRKILETFDLDVSLIDPLKYVNRVASIVGASGKAQTKTVEILHQLQKVKMKSSCFSGKSPTTLAAAALYIACRLTGENKTEVNIARAAGTTEVSIRNNMKTIEVALGLKVSRGHSEGGGPHIPLIDQMTWSGTAEN